MRPGLVVLRSGATKPERGRGAVIQMTCADALLCDPPAIGQRVRPTEGIEDLPINGSSRTLPWNGTTYRSSRDIPSRCHVDPLPPVADLPAVNAAPLVRANVFRTQRRMNSLNHSKILLVRHRATSITRHSRVCSSMTVSLRNAHPWRPRLCTKSSLQM